MLLRNYLETYKRKQLIEETKLFGLKNCSGLRKAVLIDRIMECFCTEEFLRSRMACLTKEQMDLFRKACSAPQDISMDQIIDGMQLYRQWFGGFENPTDQFCVYEEVAEIFQKIDDEAFHMEQNKKGWMMKCIQFFVNYYGLAPIEIIYKLYNLKMEDSIGEMMEMLGEMPIDVLESFILPMGKLGLQGLPKDDPLYSSKAMFVHIPVLENKELNYLLDEQRDKEFYIPSVSQIEEIGRIGYEASSFAYKKLKDFFIRNMHMSEEHAVTWCLQVWAGSYEGENPAEVINKMSETGIVFKSDKQMQEFLGVLMEAHNSTRMKENRGHTPNELRHKAVRSAEKIYPNAFCPCGSGKKYKKCCGRKKDGDYWCKTDVVKKIPLDT